MEGCEAARGMKYNLAKQARAAPHATSAEMPSSLYMWPSASSGPPVVEPSVTSPGSSQQEWGHEYRL